MGYTADIITEYLDNTRSLETVLNDGDAIPEQWELIGRTLRLFHDHGVDHADLNARNILVDDNRQVFLVDFDRGKLRGLGSWRDENLRRLQRSLRKVALESGSAFDSKGWLALEAGYGSAR